MVAAMADARCASIAAGLALLVAASARADDPPSPPPAPASPTVPAPPGPDPGSDPDSKDSIPIGEIIVVTATTPLHGSHLPKDHVPANVQTISAEDLADHKSLDLSAYMGEAIGSVNI